MTQPDLQLDELPALSLAGVNTPRLDDYFGLWHYDPARFAATWATALQTDLIRHIAQPHARVEEGNSEPRLQRSSGVAIIDLRGSLMKAVGSMDVGTSTVRVRQRLRMAARDEAISGILLVIDSPGGTHSGTADVADDVRHIAATKPVYAFVEDLAASAAYWIASQATKVYANNSTAFIGSIGTFIGMYDMSKQAEMKGLKPVVIRSSPLKGAGFPGEPITDEQKAMFQDLVDAAFAQFSSEVQSGRRMNAEQLAAVSNAKLFEATAALKLGLIDGIQSFDATLDQLRNTTTKPKAGARSAASPEQSAMSTDTDTKPQAATLAELKAACEGADSDFLVEQLDKGATVAAATKAWNTTLLARLQNANDAKAKAEADAEAAKTKSAETAKPKGGHAVGTRMNAKDEADTDDQTGDAIADFNAKVSALVAKGTDRMAAIAKVAAANPDLHDAYVEALPRVNKKR